MATQYKFVEVAPVTAESLEDCVNEWVARGFALEGVRFVVTEHSKRPAMAFVSFTRSVASEIADGEAPRTPPHLVPGDTGEDEDDAPSVIVQAAEVE